MSFIREGRYPNLTLAAFPPASASFFAAFACCFADSPWPSDDVEYQYPAPAATARAATISGPLPPPDGLVLGVLMPSARGGVSVVCPVLGWISGEVGLPVGVVAYVR